MAHAYSPSILNLASVPAPDRAAAWVRSTGVYFPGASFSKPPVNPRAGVIQRVPFGAGCLWTIVSPPMSVRYAPPQQCSAQAMFSVMLQREGSTSASQCGRTCTLQPGDLCVLDNVTTFELEVAKSSRVIFLQIPRHAALSRNAGLECCTAQALGRQERGTSLLANLLCSVHESARFLDSAQRAAALESITQMLAVPKHRASNRPDGRAGERIAAAITLIDAQLHDPMLTAERIACVLGLSRRRLDYLMSAHLSSTVTAQIWGRRLMRAATELRDRRFANMNVTQVGFAVGFQDTAHFSRAFKRRYGCSPSDWRKAMAT